MNTEAETILFSRRSVGSLTIYERKNRPPGVRRYCVGHEDGRILEDFGRYKKAVRWAKEQNGWEAKYDLVSLFSAAIAVVNEKAQNAKSPASSRAERTFDEQEN